MQLDKIAVVILNWNGIGFLRKFLGTVVQHSALPGCTIWVADNGSTDGSAGWTESEHSSVKVLRFPENLGYAGGYAKALGLIDAEYFVLLNSDVEVTPGWLAPLIETMEKNRFVAACQPKILSYGNRNRFEYAGASGGFIDRFGYPFCRGRIFQVTEYDNGQYDTEADIFWASGACMAVRAEAYRKAGGLDPSFFAHMEEIDLCWRLHRLGYSIRAVPSSTIYHVGGGTLRYESPGKTYLNFRNNLFMLYKNLPKKGFRGRLLARKCLDGMAALLFLLTGRLKNCAAVLRAHGDYYRAMPSLRIARDKVRQLHPDSNNIPSTILNKSIVFMFYVRRCRQFSDLKL